MRLLIIVGASAILWAAIALVAITATPPILSAAIASIFGGSQ